MSPERDYADDIDVTEVYIGIQQSGKSDKAFRSALALAEKANAFILIHDSGKAAIRNKERYPDYDYKLHYATKDSDSFFLKRTPIHLVNSEAGEDVFPFLYKLTERGDRCIILIDEITNCQEIQPNVIGKRWRKLIAQRRKYRAGLIFCMQDPTMASRFLVSTATHIECFRINHEDNLRALRKVGYNAEQVSTISNLPQFESLILKQGFGSIGPK